MAKLSDEEIAEFVKRAMETQDRSLKGYDWSEIGYRIIGEVTQELFEEGIPVEAIAMGAAVALGRMNELKVRAEIARNIIQVQPMPPAPSTIFYYKGKAPDDDEG